MLLTYDPIKRNCQISWEVHLIGPDPIFSRQDIGFLECCKIERRLAALPFHIPEPAAAAYVRLRWFPTFDDRYFSGSESWSPISNLNPSTSFRRSKASEERS